MTDMVSGQQIEPVIIGAGPAGLTAAREFLKHGVTSIVLESDKVVGGISRTVQQNGWRFDIGGHRFFTKVARIEEVWHEILPDDDFMLRPRMSRIYYNKKFFDYPLKASNALRNLGLLEAIRCVLSYIGVRIRPPQDQSSFEGWTAARFGWRLYGIFFKGYTEKVWGIPATEIRADWAAQRIKNLSLFSAIINSLRPRRNQKDITSLIEEFQYPKLGPGMLWEACTDQIMAGGTQVFTEHRVVGIELLNGTARTVTTASPSGQKSFNCSHIISSMPIPHLIQAISPPPPKQVLDAANSLRYRDFLTVALVIPESAAFPDNWIYIHEPSVHVGRIQNFGSWSPHMVKPGFTCLGLEYFVFEGDALWNSPNAELGKMATSELFQLGLIDSEELVIESYVVRMPRAYPLYDLEYKTHIEVIRNWISQNATNVYLVGRNGMHKYNNQDHSMLTAILSAENILGADHDIWAVNVEEEYHEESAK